MVTPIEGRDLNGIDAGDSMAGGPTKASKGTGEQGL
jgi:hypothetical protein